MFLSPFGFYSVFLAWFYSILILFRYCSDAVQILFGLRLCVVSCLVLLVSDVSLFLVVARMIGG